MTTKTKRTKARGRRKTTTETTPRPQSWTCPRCAAADERQLICAQCGEYRPDLTPGEQALALALGPDDESEAVWDELRLCGASDEEILAAAATALRSRSPVHYHVGDEMAVVWLPDPDAEKLGLWFMPTGEFTTELKGKPDLAGKRVADMVRDLYGIPAAGAGNGATTSIDKTVAAQKADVAAETDEETAAKKPAAKKRKTSSNGAPRVELLNPKSIDAFPLNPRDEAEFDEASLKELGEDLKRRQVQSVVVREIDGRYQLIAGERRWRAAKLVKLAELRCEIVDCSDAEAIWMCGQENERRMNWSPIARARWYRELKKAEGLSDRRLAQRVGLSQPVVTGVMQLLALPEDPWRKWLITRVITPTVVRPLLRYATKRPQVLAKVADLLDLGERNLEDDPLTVRGMERTVAEAVAKCTRSMNRDEYGGGAPLFGITKKRREELDVEKVKINTWGPAVNRAWNVKRWNQLQKEARQAGKRSQQRKKEGKPTTRSRYSGAFYAEQTKTWQLQRLLNEWREKLVVEHWPDDVDFAVRVAVLIDGLGQTIAKRLVSKKFARYQPVRFDDVAELTAEEYFDELPRAVKAEAAEGGFQSHDLAEICRALKIDVAGLWRPTKKQLDCFCVADLRKFKALPKGERKDKKLSKDKLIEHFLKHWPAGWIPTPVRKILGVKSAGTKK